jgi:hypothetical protein
MMAGLLGVLVKRSEDRTSRVMRGRVAIVMEDILNMTMLSFSSKFGTT